MLKEHVLPFLTRADTKELRAWVQEQRKSASWDEDSRDDDIVGDPLLVLEWNLAGLAAANALNANHTKQALLTYLTNNGGYVFKIPTSCITVW